MCSQSKLKQMYRPRFLWLQVFHHCENLSFHFSLSASFKYGIYAYALHIQILRMDVYEPLNVITISTKPTFVKHIR